MGELVGKELFPASTDPVVNELNRLVNQLKDKERELGVAHTEIKSLRATELLKDKAVVELSNELKKLEEKLGATENLLGDKNFEIKKLIIAKKEALAAQFAAEAALRRIHATQRDEDFVPIEAVIAPLESDIRMYINEIVLLQEDKKALERITKSKEAALVEAQKILKSALERALIVENVQNENFELKRQIEIVQEENKLLDKTNRQKVLEVEKLGQTIQDLEESILAGGAIANVVRDYQRQVSELNEEKRTLERELARTKVSANRVATVVANEWKDDSDKVMPVKQWLEERRFLQGEIQRLQDKLAISERTAKAEAQLKDKLRLRLKTLEEGLKHVSGLSAKQAEKSEAVFGFPSHKEVPRKRSTSQPRASLSANNLSVLQQPNSGSEGVDSTKSMKRVNSLKKKFVSGENLVKKNLWASRGKFFDDIGKENAERKVNSDRNTEVFLGQSDEPVQEEMTISGEIKTNADGDLVSGFLYDRLQKEVINLRKSHGEKDGMLNVKNDEIKMLLKKLEVLTKAMEVESKKMRREAVAREKEALLVKSEDIKQKGRNTNISRRDPRHIDALANTRS